MISILIPVYNTDVTKLVTRLHKECGRLKAPFEIIVFDDGSREKYKLINRSLSAYFGVNYTELSENLGRARIRNWLAKSASFDHLLFLDADSAIKGRNFLKTYSEAIGTSPVISGGRQYGRSRPRAKSKVLHWLYGRRRESKPARFRNKHPYLFFHSNNFLVEKSLMVEMRFDENVEGYGYEDLLFAERLKERGIPILHIDNPTEHKGLEKNSVFLAKQRHAIDNLVKLRKDTAPLETRLTRAADKLRKARLQDLYLKLYDVLEDRIEKNLMSARPNIRFLDFFKMQYYLRASST